jgi:hypothetical protein
MMQLFGPVREVISFWGKNQEQLELILRHLTYFKNFLLVDATALISGVPYFQLLSNERKVQIAQNIWINGFTPF